MTLTVVHSGVDGAKALLGAVDGRVERVDAELSERSDSEIIDLVAELEVLGRRVAALQLAVMDQIDDRRLYADDGHASAKVMVRHLGRLSAGEAAGREKARKALHMLAAVKEAYAEGSIGTDQVRLLAKVHANRRVAHQMAERDAVFVRDAQRLGYLEFELGVRHWERLTDQDGAEPTVERCHERRDFTLIQDHFGLGWEIRGGCGSLSGAAMDEILQHYVQAEYEADWEKARAEHGNEVTADDLPRTAAQRRSDALWQIFQDAASTPPGSGAPRFVHNIVWDAESFEQMVRELDNRRRQPLDIDTHRCSTIDGMALAPTEAIMNSLVNEVRRVVVDAAGVVIDLGNARAFTG